MSIFKNLSADDKVSTKTLLHEAIPITGTILSGAYGTFPSDSNIQNFTHGMFQSVYDYPYLSSSANHIFDITFGTSADGEATSVQTAKKDNIYSQMAQILSGYDKDGNIQKFDEDGNLISTSEKIDNAIFLSFSRLLVKDEIKKGSFELELGVSASYADAMNQRVKITDYGAAQSYRVNSPAGEYGILYVSNSVGTPLSGATGPTDLKAGLIYYQAGVAVLNGAIFMAGTGSGDGGFLSSSAWMNSAESLTFTGSLISEHISSSADHLRHRIYNMQFNNTIELNSTVYFCRVKHNEFNYSSNPTYLSGSQIRVKNQGTDVPISYITSIGLYSADNQLLAVGKFSEPIRKDSNIELTFRARLDY